MAEYNLKKLSRGDLLEMLVAQGEELEALKQKLADTEAKLYQKELIIDEAGSIADAGCETAGSVADSGSFGSADSGFVC